MRLAVLLSAIFAALLAGAFALRSASGATPTDDEPTYLGQGAYLLRTGDFYAPVLKWQPPLALYVTAPGLIAVDVPQGALAERPRPDSLTALGDRILSESGSGPERVLAWARAPVVLVFAATAALAAWIAGRLGGRAAAVLAGALVAASPMFFGHGGVATTDAVAVFAALVAVAPLATTAADERARPVTWRRAGVLGAALGVALLAKHTAIVLVPVTAFSVAHLARRGGSSLRGAAGAAGLALAAAGLVVWAGYGFHTGPLVPPDSKGDVIRRLGLAWAEGPARTWPVPAPSYWQSIVFQSSKQHDRLYFHFFGETAKVGWWSYFPVVTLGKATLGSLGLLVVAALTLRARRPSAADWVLFSAFALPFAAAVASRHNLGVRHVLPALAPLFVLAAVRAARDGLGSGLRRGAVAALVLLHLAEGASGSRDGIAWWNRAAGGTEGGWRIAVQSNADWGQGFSRLRRDVDALGLQGDVWVMPGGGPEFGRSRLEPMGFRVCTDASRREPLPASGWLAVSTSVWRKPGHDPVTDAPPDHFLGGCFRVYRLPLQGERTP